MRTIKASVKNIYVQGQKVQSAICTHSTKPIFRSESARYVLFVQMSKEMWDFDGGGSGETMFGKVIDGFLPQLFKRWQQINAKHIVTVVLFTRMQYDIGASADSLRFGLGANARTVTSGTPYLDFYRVVVSDMACREWSDVLSRMKTEYKTFLRDVSVHRPSSGKQLSPSDGLAKVSEDGPTWVISGQPCIAARGNILEAINLAALHFSHDQVDCDLLRTGVSVALVTPGTGLFEVDHKLLARTSVNLVSKGIRIDLICLARMPLHSVPLFKYRQSQTRASEGSPEEPEMRNITGFNLEKSSGPNSGTATITRDSALCENALELEMEIDAWCYGIPYWLDISFWTSNSEETHYLPRERLKLIPDHSFFLANRQHRTFRPRVRMYELQMLGLVDSNLHDISLPYMPTIHGNTASRGLLNRTVSSFQSSSLGQIRNARSQADVPESIPNVSPIFGSSLNFTSKQQLHSMGLYDEEIFNDLHPERSPSIRKLGRSSKTQKLQLPVNPKQLDEGSSITIRDHKAPSRDQLIKGDEGLDNVAQTTKMATRSEELVISSESSKNESKSRITMFPRHISLGPRGFGIGTPKAIASTELISEHAIPDSLPGQGLRTRMVETTALAASSVQNKSKNISRPVSTHSPDSYSDRWEQSQSSDPEAQGSSRPIPIRKATAFRISSNSKSARGQDENIPTKSVRKGEQSSYCDLEGYLDQGTKHTANSSLKNQASIRKSCPAPTLSDGTVPWLTTVNPSNPKPDISLLNCSGRWQHVFPRALRASKMKWKSLCSPASVPLTVEEAAPTHDLSESFDQLSYRVDTPKEHELMDRPRPSYWLLREMIALRLSHGYQVTVHPHGKSHEAVDIFDKDLAVKVGATLELSKSGDIHKLQVVEGKAIQVTRFILRSPQIHPQGSIKDEGLVYTPAIRTILADHYETRDIQMFPHHATCDWRRMDTFISLQARKPLTEIDKNLPSSCARFVLIPVDSPTSHRRPMKPLNEDNEEEIRLEGIRKLTQMWQRFRYVSNDERRFQTASRNRKDTNPLDILYQTQNPSLIVAAEKDTMAENVATGASVELLPESELFQRSNLRLDLLAQTIQGEKGVRMMDRRWHWRLHYNCFIGFEFTSWLLQNFRDVESRDEAVELGNDLMTNGLFQHVEQRHNFRDGHFFYQIASDYRTPRAEVRSWFGARKSIPPTPQSEDVNKDLTNRPSSGTGTDAGDRVEGNQSMPANEKRNLGVALSKSMLYDVDHRKRSYRPELVTLHYDRLHNPDNCYHIRIDWLNVTAKLIEDAVVSWANTVERFGLKLVEVPIAEACAVTAMHPFRAPYKVVLAKAPPNLTPENQTYLDAKSFSAQPAPEKDFYQKLLLKKFDYVLDLEAATDFPHDVDVTYAWGKPNYRYPQYIHRSGMVLAQIVDDGNIILLANRLYSHRSTAGQEASRTEHIEMHNPGTHGVRAAGQRPSPHASPASSPLTRPASEPAVSHWGSMSWAYAIPEQLKSEFEAFCYDETALDAFYSEALVKSPLPGSRTPCLESAIPTLGLPPNLSLGEGSTISDERRPRQ